MSSSKVLFLYLGDEESISDLDLKVLCRRIKNFEQSSHFVVTPDELGFDTHVKNHDPSEVEFVYSVILAARKKSYNGEIEFGTLDDYDELTHIVVYFDSTVTANWLLSQSFMDNLLLVCVGTVMIVGRQIQGDFLSHPSSMELLNQGWLITKHH